MISQHGFWGGEMKKEEIGPIIRSVVKEKWTILIMLAVDNVEKTPIPQKIAKIVA